MTLSLCNKEYTQLIGLTWHCYFVTQEYRIYRSDMTSSLCNKKYSVLIWCDTVTLYQRMQTVYWADMALPHCHKEYRHLIDMICHCHTATKNTDSYMFLSLCNKEYRQFIGLTWHCHFVPRIQTVYWCDMTLTLQQRILTFYWSVMTLSFWTVTL